VVFVHGIGTQAARDTLFDWAGPIIEVLAEWRREHDERHPTETVGENPVSAASVTDPANPWIELDVPAAERRDRGQWLFTEAYWAGDVRAPSFPEAVRYLFRRIPGIVGGIAEGYGARETSRRKRLETLVKDNESNPDPVVTSRVEDLQRSLNGRWRITDGLDKIWQFQVVRAVLAGSATIAALFVLGIYSVLHSIPIDAVRKKVDIALADTFIVEWFGDLPVLLDDQSQSAAIRTRLLERVQWLKTNGCRVVVIVAHSGGTIVSFATLLRYDHATFDVAKSSRSARRSSSAGVSSTRPGTGCRAIRSAATCRSIIPTCAGSTCGRRTILRRPGRSRRSRAARSSPSTASRTSPRTSGSMSRAGP
jgi:hypothetical protein